MEPRADSIRVVHPLFQAEGGGSIPTSALALWFGELSIRTAVALNRLWHSRLPRLQASNVARTTNHVCYGAQYGGVWYAVAVWSSPVARNLPQDTTLELRRFAIAPDAPKNTASRMLGWMVRTLRLRFPAVLRLVSYQDTEAHTGTIYRAAGWSAAALNPDGSWDRPSRHRRQADSLAPKVRWECLLTPP